MVVVGLQKTSFQELPGLYLDASGEMQMIFSSSESGICSATSRKKKLVETTGCLGLVGEKSNPVGDWSHARTLLVSKHFSVEKSDLGVAGKALEVVFLGDSSNSFWAVGS